MNPGSNLVPATRLTDKQRWAAYQDLFQTPTGQLVLEDLQAAHYLYSSLVGNGPVDPNKLVMREGERNVVLRIMAILESKESDYV